MTNEERWQLVLSVMPMIRKLANKIVGKVVGRDHAEDAFQECMLEAFRLTQSWRSDGGKTFAAWAYNPIAWKMGHIRRKIIEFRDATVNISHADDEVGREDTFESACRNEECRRVHIAISGLQKVEQAVIRLRHSLDSHCKKLTGEEIARVIGYRRGSVHRLESQAKRKLRLILA